MWAACVSSLSVRMSAGRRLTLCTLLPFRLGWRVLGPAGDGAQDAGTRAGGAGASFWIFKHLPPAAAAAAFEAANKALFFFLFYHQTFAFE